MISIIGILVALGAYVYTAALTRSRDSQRISDLQFIRNGLEQFYLDNRSYPTFQSSSANLPEAKWQLEGGYNCQDPAKKYLAPKYLPSLPNDPSRPFVLTTGGGCSADYFGQYLYYGLPDSASKMSFYLLARMERVQNVNYTSDVGAGLSSYGSLPNFCDATQFGANPTGCSQNYFVTSAKNN